MKYIQLELPKQRQFFGFLGFSICQQTITWLGEKQTLQRSLSQKSKLPSKKKIDQKFLASPTQQVITWQLPGTDRVKGQIPK